MRGKLITIGLAIVVGATITNPKIHSTHKPQPKSISFVNQRQTNVVLSSVTMENAPSPTPTSTPIPPKAVEIGDEEPSQQVIVSYIYEKFGEGWQGQVAQCIARHESGYNPYATHYNYNGSIDRGVFQINSVHGYAASTLYNWQSNVDIAYNMSGGGTNWNAWTTKYYCL